MPYAAPAERTKMLFAQASRSLGTANPLEAGVGRLVDEALPFESGHPAYRRKPEPVALHFREHAGDQLAFGLEPGGPLASASYRIAEGTEAIGGIVARHISPKARRWLEQRAEEARGSGYGASSWGATIGASFDRSGVNEAQISYEWGPSLMDALPASLYRVAWTAMELLPGLRPAFSTVHVNRSTGFQELTFEMTNALSLSALEPLMRELGLGHQHASLMSTCAFVLGARFVLPPETSTITFRPTPYGLELRLDVDLDRLPDVPDPLAPLLRMQMSERPGSVRDWSNWMAAFTQEGYRSPGSFSVLSVSVRPDEPARIALHLRPVAVEEPDSSNGRPDDAYSWAGPEAIGARG